MAETMKAFFEQCEAAVLEGNKDLAVELAQRVLAENMDVLAVLERGFSPGLRRAGEKWDAGEYFLPELAFSAEVMKVVLDVLRPSLFRAAGTRAPGGRVVIGTVQGDIHDIGKSVVSTLLSAHGFDVLDLGANVTHERFIEAVRDHHANLLCMSALLTTTMTGQAHVVELLEQRGMRGDVKVLVGGVPTSEGWARQISADAYAPDAVAAVEAAKGLLSRNDCKAG
jgi:corrinoid protein of di/trimethylamine methyltransferase